MSVTERELKVESSYVCTGPTSPGALHEECNVIPALTDRERAFGDMPRTANLGGTAEPFGPLRKYHVWDWMAFFTSKRLPGSNPGGQKEKSL